GVHTASASDIADITRINDSAPTLSVLAQDVTEGAVSTATVVATFSGADADVGDTLSYMLLNDPDGYFQIVGSEVRLTAAGVAAVDNDALNLTQLPAITVQVSDVAGHTASASDIADITRINDSAPTLSVLAQDVTEGAVSTATVVAIFSGADADAGDTLSYMLLNDPDGYFQIVGSEVRLTAAGVAAVDNDALNLTQLPVITVQVSDAAGHTASASDTSDITRINGAPSGADKMITISEDSSFVLSAADFGFSDTDTPANAFASVFITSLPDTGSLTLNGVLLTPGASVSAASISSGDLVFTPVGNASGHAYANFSFQVVDDGGTANGGQNTDLSANRITFDVTPVADAPTLTLSASQTFSSTTFDDFGLPSAQNWGGVSIPASSGWKTDNPGGLVEIGYENVYVSAGSATNRVIELEANTGDASNLYTDINTMLGAQYHLAFDYSARSGNELNSNINIYWAGHLLGVLNANTAGFAHFDFVIVGDGNPDRLEFRAMDSNSLGGLLDNISLQQADNIGYQGNTIALGGIVADLVDTDGSESLALHVGNIVAGSVIGDGAHTQTVGVDGVADITGWNYNSLALTPPASYRGTMTLDVQAIATEGDNLSTATTHASLAVVVLNNVPVAVADAFTTPEDTAISLLPAQLLANDGDVDGDTLSIASVQGATHGSVALVGGNVVFTPNANYNGPASFTYIVSDGHGGSSTATASLNVTPVNDGPVAAADFAAVTEAGVTPNNTPFAGTPSAIGNVLTNDTDVDSGDAKIVSAVNGLAGNVGSVLAGVYGTLTLAANGAYTYTLDNADPDTQALAQGAIPTETFTYTLRDAAGLTSSNTLTVTINGSNDAPLAVDDIVITNIAAGQAIPIPSSALLVNDSDPDSGANLSLSSVSSAQNGTVLGTNPVVFTDTTSFGTSAKIVAEAALYPGDSETQGLNNTQALAYEIGRSQFGQVSAADAPYVGNAALPSFKWTGRVDDVFGTPAVTDQDYLKVYLYAGEKIILDIDGGDSGLTTIGTDPNAVDMLLKLYNANGVELAQNDDAVNTLGGLGSVKSGYHGNSLDSYLEYTVAADGYYYIDATAFNNNANGINQDDGNYQLWVSIQPTLVAHPSSFDYKLSDGLVNDSGHVSVTTVQGSLITGGNAGEILIGGGGNDTLNSAAGDDVLIGGAGNDIMSGGLGADVFQWNFADRGAAGVPAVDTITDFSVSNSAASKDVLDLRDLLQGEHAVSSGLNNFLHFEKSGADTIVHVSSSGGFNADSHIVGSTFTNAAETQRIVLQSADLVGSNTLDQQIIQDLLSKGKLVTD
ncbi:tandem-95 repeat protein, partial [Propionivibrio sp.]|uniref:Ig-like domain-containing protein n=1 Tax=Propionivibrio sp. TaxID=2212460 RepID=UPI00260EAB0C